MSSRRIRIFLLPILVVVGVLISVIWHSAFAAGGGSIDFSSLGNVATSFDIRYQNTRFDRRTGQMTTEFIVTN